MIASIVRYCHVLSVSHRDVPCAGLERARQISEAVGALVVKRVELIGGLDGGL